MKNMTTSVLSLLVILTVSLACNRVQTENTAVDENTSDSTNTVSDTTAKTTTADAPKDISGSYEISGTNEKGAGNYKGNLEVTKREEVYQFSWDTAGKKYDGVGVRDDTTVAVAFTNGTNGKGCGVVLYKINPDGSLDGKAGYWGVNESENETATQTSGSDLAGEYEVKGKNPEGNDYAGKLSVKQEGEGYKFLWTGADTIEGFGIRQGDKAAVGLGGKQCGFVAYTINSDGSLDGKWGGYGSNSVGTETAKKKH